MNEVGKYVVTMYTEIWTDIIRPNANFFALIGLFSCILLTYKAIYLVATFQPNLSDYPYLNPPVFLSAGEAIASVAILLAVYQFRKSRGSIAFKVREYVLPVVFVTMLCGVGLTFISPFILVERPYYIFQLSVFWQVIAGILIAFSIIFLFLKSTSKGLFTKVTANKFYYVLVAELSRPSPERVDIILDTFLENFDRICEMAKNDNDDVRSYARALLDVVLGEGSMVDMISTKRLDALHYILYTIGKYELDRNHVRGLSPIIKNLFNDHGSYLYKHLDVNGLALSSNLYDQLFGSPLILNNFKPFVYPSINYQMSKKIGTEEIEITLKALSTAIETYLKSESVSARSINDGLSHLSTIFGNLCIKIQREKPEHFVESDWWLLNTISHFLGHDYAFIAYQDQLNDSVTEAEKRSTEASFYSDATINDGIAAAIYKAFEQLTYVMTDENIDDVYHIVLNLMYGMMYQYEYKTGYRDPFERVLWEQIGRNVIEQTYPAVLPIYLSFMGLVLTSDNQRLGWVGEQAERVRRLLYIDLKPLLDSKQKMVNGDDMEKALLPSYMKYVGGKFTYTMGFGKGPTKEIEEPPAESVSALIGVNLQGGMVI